MTKQLRIILVFPGIFCQDRFYKRFIQSLVTKGEKPEREKEMHPFFFAFFPKATNQLEMAGLLTYSLFIAFPPGIPGSGIAVINKPLKELTAAGTVQDSHLIPFSSVASGRIQSEP